MKYAVRVDVNRRVSSPSTRREWIEIDIKTTRRSYRSGLPPRGGSGLKSRGTRIAGALSPSPSTRREWIEIRCPCRRKSPRFVSLHAEGVD